MNRNLLMTGLGVLAGILVGRSFGPERVKVETVTVTKEVKVEDESRKLHKTERVIETVTKDGRPLKKTIIQTRAASERKTVERRDVATKESKETQNRRGVAVSLIAGLPLAEIARGPVYGAAVAIPVIGSIFLGPVLFAPPHLLLGIQGGFTF